VAGLTATGSSRYIFAMVGAGTNADVTSIDCTIEGTSAAVSMTRVFFEQGPNGFEDYAGFVIPEASLPGDGPYTLEATTSGGATPARMGIVAASIQDAPSAPVVTTANGSPIAATPASDGSLVLAGFGSSDSATGDTLTGATQVEALHYGNDGLQLGWVQQDASELSVSTSNGGRIQGALAIFAPS
jgi:hypothetical protein